MIDDRLECRPTLDWLQSRLDGIMADPPSVVADHFSICATCRERCRAAERMLVAFADRPTESPTPLFAVRTIAAIRTDLRLRRTQRWAASAAALAAGIALAIWLWPRPSAEPSNAIVVHEQLPSLDSARGALAEVARKAAVDTVNRGRMLLPREIELPTATSMALLPDLSPLEGARQGLVEGFEPVKSSVKRAVNLLLRDFQTSADEKKN